MEPYERRRYKKNIVSLAAVNRQLSPCELEVCDRDFLLEHLPGNISERKAVKSKYREVWLEAMAQENVPFKRQNAGRRAANTWLRKNWWKGYPNR